MLLDWSELDLMQRQLLVFLVGFPVLMWLGALVWIVAPPMRKLVLWSGIAGDPDFVGPGTRDLLRAVRFELARRVRVLRTHRGLVPCPACAAEVHPAMLWDNNAGCPLCVHDEGCASLMGPLPLELHSHTEVLRACDCDSARVWWLWVEHGRVPPAHLTTHPCGCDSQVTCSQHQCHDDDNPRCVSCMQVPGEDGWCDCTHVEQ